MISGGGVGGPRRSPDERAICSGVRFVCRKYEDRAMIGGQLIRIRLKGYDHGLLDSAVGEIVQTVRRTGGRVAGPIPLPTRIEKYTVNRSSFIDKKSREQFEIRTHKRLLDILEPTQQTIDELGKLELSTGIDVEIKLQ